LPEPIRLGQSLLRPIKVRQSQPGTISLYLGLDRPGRRYESRYERGRGLSCGPAYEFEHGPSHGPSHGHSRGPGCVDAVVDAIMNTAVDTAMDLVMNAVLDPVIDVDTQTHVSI
jgi:hypothetical protein